MSEPLEGLLKKVLALNEKDRASLAGALIESLHGETLGGSDTAWETEIQRRVTELDARAVKTIPWSEVRERLFHGYE
jgi:putative addiction module component (TIGR02574 family)